VSADVGPVVAERVGGRVVSGRAADRPSGAVVDSRAAGPGELFFGLRGERADGGAFAPEALAAGAWGTVVTPEHVEAARAAAGEAVVIEVEDPLAGLGRLASAYLRDLRDDGASVVAVTGSTGKTSTKDILAALLAQQLPTHANPENLNTEIGLPLSVLAAPPQTRAVVLEMAMRGPGQIAELTAIAEPDVGVVVNVGPVHLEQLGSLEAVAAAKAELIRDLRPGAACVVPAAEPLLAAHLRADLDTITFGPGGDVSLRSFEGGRARIAARGETIELELAYDEPYNVTNTLAAVAAAQALGMTPAGRVEPRFSSLRGEVVELEGGVTVVNDSYNANPVSMRAALEHLAATAGGRSIAILGGMAELGEERERFHREVGQLADELGIGLLVTVGEPALAYLDGFSGDAVSVATPEEAGSLLGELAAPGDRVLIKGSRAAGLERVLAEVRGG
jgi:UDP-N-acetylmuramoyl-tripeptide--D-alanyl-D-alanine ligase